MTDLMEIKAEIEKALRRDAGSTKVEITVARAGDQLVLNGFVPTLADREEAERVARRLGDGSHVRNGLVIAPTEQSPADDPVYEASLESFPASDPPAWTTR